MAGVAPKVTLPQDTSPAARKALGLRRFGHVSGRVSLSCTSGRGGGCSGRRRARDRDIHWGRAGGNTAAVVAVLVTSALLPLRLDLLS